MHAFGKKPIDFTMRNLPEGHTERQEKKFCISINPKMAEMQTLIDFFQYFVVCVPQFTKSDRQAKANIGSGPLVPRIIKVCNVCRSTLQVEY